jgi:hypothetical protein
MKVEITRGKMVNVDTLAQASQACRTYIGAKGIGNSRWSGGTLFVNSAPIGYVSYNGKVWSGSAKAWQPGMTPLYVPTT